MAAAAALLWGCESAPPRVEIVAHYVPACAPASPPSQLELIALGDFDRSNVSVSILRTDADAQSVSLPPGTQAAELNTLGDTRYWGTGRLDTHNQLSILLWPKTQPCPLGLLEGAASASWLVSASERSSSVLVLHAAAAPGAGGFAVDLSDASQSALVPDRNLATARWFASLSELGDGFVLAGGRDPDSGAVLQTTEIFEAHAGGFSSVPNPLSLEIPRARHAALALPTGSTLLIGGESASGDALRSVEVLSTAPARFSRALELLETARIQPQALLLDRDRILVGGGYVPSSDPSAPEPRVPVAGVEFLSIDLAEVSRPSIALEPPALDRAFVALAQGGALAVGGCEMNAATPGCVACGQGCVSRAVWWIDPQGAAHELEPLSVELASATPKLIPAASGAPWLMANGRLGRFDPWEARFVPMLAAASGSDSQLLGEPRAVGPHLFVWLEADAGAVRLAGFYHSQRGPFTQDVAPLLLGSVEGIVPHRPPTRSSSADDLTLRYTAGAGLELQGSAAVVSVADTEYADFTLELSLASGPPPLLQLMAAGGRLEEAASFGGLQCPWPDLEPGSGEPNEPVRLRAERRGDSVRLRLLNDIADLEPPAACQRSLPERVGVQLVGTRSGVTRLTRIDIRRSLD